MKGQHADCCLCFFSFRMSLAVDISHARRSASPNNSGRSTPLSAKLRSKDDENLTRTDKPYKRYASNVERALSSFDSALQEWADYISFLGRLLKALQTKPPNTTTIPFKTIVAKRLSQCVNPRLPAGVHQKTLDVYSYVFKTLGNDGLSKDLSLYLPGLAPTLSFAALSVKPSLLKLFEAYILPLGPKPLRPALKAVILALLPGLEEDSSEEFDRTLGLFATLKRAMAVEESGGLNALDSSGDQYFWQCFFLASITNPSRRSGALAYLTRSLPKLGSASPIILDPEKMNGDPVEADKLNDPATEAVTSPEPGLLIRCFCAGLQDQQLLIQRGFLDLLVTHLPLHSLVLRQKVDSQDVQKLVAAAASVVARREMSLNRRLWSWFLGPDPAVDTESAPSPGLFSPSTDYVVTPSRDRAALQADYFRRFGLDPLVRSITMMIDDTSSQTQDKLRPLRICLSLMDRWEIGALVVPRLFLPAMRSVWLYSRNSTSPDSIAEVVRSASVFFDGVESGLIWSEIYGLISQALPMTGYTKTRSEESIDLTIFMVFNFNIREEEMLIIHIPLLSLILLLGLRTLISIQNIHENDSTFEPALRLVSRLVDMIPERAFEPDPTLHGARVGPSQMEEQEILSRIEEFYMKNHGSLDVEDQPVSAQDLAQLLLLNTTSLVAQELRSIVHTRHLDVTIGILENLIRKIPLSTTPNLANMTSSLMYVVENSADGGAGVPFPIVAAAGSTIAAFRSSSKSVEWLDDHSLRLWIASLVKSLWSFLSPAQPKYHVEAVRSLWRLHSAAPDRHLVESSVTTLVLANPSDAGAGRVTPEGARRFATLWMHSPSTAMAAQDRRSSLTRMPAESLVATKQSTHELSVLERPLLLVLDTLNDEKSNSFVFVVGWLQSLPNIHLIADVLICVLQAGTHFPPSDQIKAERDHGEAIGIDDPQILIYYLELMSNLIRYATNNVWPALARITIFESDSTDSESNSLYLAKLCLRLLSYRDMVASRPAEYPSKIHLAAVTLLQQLLQGPSQASLIDLSFDALLLDELTAAVHRGDTLLQVALMDLTVEAFAIRLTKEEQDQTPIRPQINRRESSKNSPRISISADRIDTKARPSSISIPSELLDCLKLGLTDPKSRPIIEDWIDFLDHCLPLYGEGLFQILLSLVDCLCTTSESILSLMQNTFKNNGNQLVGSLEPTLSSLLGGLEQTLARSHDRLISGEVNMTPVKTPEQPQGFFGNMVSGVFTSDPQKTRSLKANNRLTVLLCFKDAVLICYKVWSWGTSGSTVAPCDATASASFTYNAVRLRNRARRIFEHLFTAEPLECLETLIDIWNGGGKAKEVKESLGIFNLLHVLEGSRPKNTIPALFNAMYSRTNPNALDPLRKSTLTSNLSDFTLAAFLVEYVNSLDDDAMDEIWGDCAIFLRDVLANPLPHRQTLPMLLDFTASLGQKVDNTNFGEQRRMRRDLGVSSRLMAKQNPELTVAGSIRSTSYGHIHYPINIGIARSEYPNQCPETKT